MPSFFTKSKSLNDELLSYVDKTKGLPFHGIYFNAMSVLMVTDVSIAKQILVKDFDFFVDRVGPIFMDIFDTDQRCDKIFGCQLTNASGELWKNLRSTFSPIFTSGKMKALMVFIKETSNRMLDAIDKCAKNNEDFELKKMLGRYSMDTIASCAFGVDAESFTNPDSKFALNASKMFEQNKTDALKMAFAMIPGGKAIINALGIAMGKKEETEFFYEAVMSSLRHRRETQTRRNDLIDLMLDAIKGDISDDNHEMEEDQFEKDAKLNHVPKKGEFDELIIVATAIILMVAGYDTTGTTMAFACYHLAKHPDMQERLRLEVEAVTDPDNPIIDYEAINKMTYLDQIIWETLRFCTPLALIQRCATKDYKIPGHDLVIEKGTDVWINAAAIHSNPLYYATPEEFNPEHFSKEAKAARDTCAFLPFGQGPRGCLGMRFALLEAKMGLANVVKSFHLSPSIKTKEPLELDPYSGIAYVKHGLYIKAERRSQ